MLKKITEKLKKRRLLLALLAVFFAANIFLFFHTFSEKTTSSKWDGSISESFRSGSGTAKDPYVIKDGSELAYFFSLINGEKYLDYFNKYYSLENNIDLNNIDFSFLNVDKIFSGNFDGNGYTISNVLISNPTINEETAYFGLFNKTLNADIHDLNFNYVTFKFSADEEINNVVSTKDYSATKVIEELNETITETNTSIETTLEENITDNNETAFKSENANDTVESSTADETNVAKEKEENQINVNETKEENNTVVETNTTAENETDIIVEAPLYSKINAALVIDATSSTFNNISINNASILEIADEKIEYETSILLLNDLDKNTISNINIKANSSIEDTTLIINDYSDARISNVIYFKTNLKFANDFKLNDTIFEYYTNNANKVYFTDKYPVENILETLNNNSNFEWTVQNGEFRIKNNGSDSFNPLLAKTGLTIRTAPSAHASGIDGNTVYVNDYTMDINYYGGLNYTTSSNGTTPTLLNKNIYNENNLVYVQIHYHGSNYEGTATGYVSNSEQQSDFIYYKVYRAVGNQITFDLIDNPYSRRPNDLTFNGWAVDDIDATVTIDMDTYIRSVTLPVTYTNGVPNNIELDVYAVWNDGKITEYASSWSNTFNQLDSEGFHEATVRVPVYETTYNGILYTYETATYGSNYPDGAVNIRGNSVQNVTGRCWSLNCTYYLQYNTTYPVEIDPEDTYYYLNPRGNAFIEYTPEISGYEYAGSLRDGSLTAGYFREVSVPRNTSLEGYYDEDGILLHGTKTSATNAYQLITMYDRYGNLETADLDNETYYYLTTRDTNVVVLHSNVTSTWASGQNKPFTFTSMNNGNSYTNNYFRPTGAVTCYADTRIEQMKIYYSTGSLFTSNQTGSNGPFSTSKQIEGRGFNLKLGRGLVADSTTKYNFNNVNGNGTGSKGTSRTTRSRYTLIIESGFYNTVGTVNITGASGTYYVDAYGTYGNDYDRVRGDNTKLKVAYTILGSGSATIYGESASIPAIYHTVKSGTIGKNGNITDYLAGIYAGQIYVTNSLRSPSQTVVEGGDIKYITGGVGYYTTNKAYANTLIYIKGGSVDAIFGGAGKSTTYGDRIIQLTGGTINYSVFGGSNGAVATSSDGGEVDGNTYIYAGGNSVIGNATYVANDTQLTFNQSSYTNHIESGSIFGCGNGNESYTEVGAVNNNYVVIDGGTHILGNVYGGSNYGITGTVNAGTFVSKINIHDGANIDGSVYGSGNNNGSGNSSHTVNTTITMDGGKVGGSIYGGSRTSGTLYGATEVNIVDGTIETDVYGGGEGNNTYVSKGTSVTIGTTESGPDISGNVYGGSAYGTVNATNKSTTTAGGAVNVIVNNGNITGSVFGGAKGSSTNRPYVKGNITVSINGGTIDKVFGGFDESGKPEKTVKVFLDGGVINEAYGGGNKTDIDETNITLRNTADVGTLYGGSNQLGTVVTTNVTVSGGEVDEIFGGNNSGGTCGTTNVRITNGTVNDAVYGGGNQVATATTNVTIVSVANEIPAVYGGGNQAGATTTNVTVNSSNSTNVEITNLYGGSNQSGTVTDSYVTFNNGTFGTLYGGNNSGGSTTTSHVAINNGVGENIYGGGNQAPSGTTNVTIAKVNLSENAYGGGFGSSATVTNNANITITGGTYGTADDNTTGNVYGGGNAGAVEGNTTVSILNSTAETITINNNIYGGGNNGEVGGDTTVTYQKGTCEQIFGGGNNAGVGGGANVTITGGTIESNVFGGGNNGAVDGNTDVNVGGSSTSIYALYGGGNGSAASVGESTQVTVSNGTIETNIFGGGNNGEVIGSTVVTFGGGSANNLYAGGNNAKVDENTSVTVSNGTLSGNVYGGGNNGEVGGNTTTNIDGGVIGTTSDNTTGIVFGGGNHADVTGNTTVSVRGGIIPTAIYGGGNEGAVGGNTNVNIYNITNGNPDVFGGGNQAGATTTNITLATSTPNNINLTNIYGGSNQSGTIEETNITINTGTVTNVYGGNNLGGSAGETNITQNGGTLSNVYGGGNQAAVTGDTSVTVTNGNITNVLYGGGNQADVNGNTKLTLNGGTIGEISVYNSGNVYGGGNAGDVDGSTLLTLNGITITGDLYGGGNQGIIGDSTDVNIESASISKNIFGGGNQGIVTNSTDVEIKNITSTNVTAVYGGGNKAGVGESRVHLVEDPNADNNITILEVYGGSNQSGTVDSTTVIIDHGSVGTIYGGNNLGGSVNETYVEISDGTIGTVYGGGNQAISGQTQVVMTGGTASGNVYGGGNQGIVNQDSSVNITDATIEGSAYGGGNGASAVVRGSSSISINGSSTIGTSDCSNLVYCSVFGGGNSADTGTSSTNSSSSIVNITGGNIYGNVFGGSNQGKIYGYTTVNAGDYLPDTTEPANIHIYGTIFGGGNKVPGSGESINYTTPLVTKYAIVNVNGLGYEDIDFTIDGSIYGEGNLSTESGTKTINILNYGTYSLPRKLTSIQRCDYVNIDNSSLVIYGAKDSLNKYSEKFTFSRVLHELDIKNNTTLYLEEGFNWVTEFKSLNENGTLATVEIDGNNITKSTDNRVYVLEGNNLNIATSEDVDNYGHVYGMSFFGLYKYNANGTVFQGNYGKLEDGASYLGGTVFGNAYVQGLHASSMDTTIDGFYTNYEDEDGKVDVQYIEPIPEDAAYYQWILGETTEEPYELNIIISKYSTLGSAALGLSRHVSTNTTFSIKGFDYSDLEDGIQLIDRYSIPRVANTDEEADTIFGLRMESSNSGWLNNGETTFKTSEAEPVAGTIKYIGANTSDTPTLMFYTDHSKNISSSGDLGSVTIIMQSVTQVDDLTRIIRNFNVIINLQREYDPTTKYEGTITAGRKYEAFRTTTTKLNSKSTFSVYFSIFDEVENYYELGDHRALVSNYVLPLNTKITMLDLSGGAPEYYYHVINAADVANAEAQLSTQNDIRYMLSMFEVMGAQGSGVYYDDAAKNIQYYNSDEGYFDEEFLFIVDFSDANITTDSLNNTLLFELLGSMENSKVGILAAQQLQLKYDLYYDKDASISSSGSIAPNKVYSGETAILDLNVQYTQSKEGAAIVYDTQYFDSKIGVNLSLINSDGERVSGAALLGLYYQIDDDVYFPGIDGSVRIKLSDRVDNLEKWVKICTGTSSIASGIYTVHVETFGSPDGIYYGAEPSGVMEFTIQIVNEIYGLDVTTTPESMIIDATTGQNQNNKKYLQYNLLYNSGLTNPKINVKMYRRNTNSIDDTTYSIVNLADYVTDSYLQVNEIQHEYNILSSPRNGAVIHFEFKSELVTGTYKLEFILYDGASRIGSIEKYIIIIP